MLPVLPASSDEENPLGSSDEDESETNEEGVTSGGHIRPRQDVGDRATLGIDDDVAEDEALLPLEDPGGYYLMGSAPTSSPSIRHSLAKRFCFGCG